MQMSDCQMSDDTGQGQIVEHAELEGNTCAEEHFNQVLVLKSKV